MASLGINIMSYWAKHSDIVFFLADPYYVLSMYYRTYDAHTHIWNKQGNLICKYLRLHAYIFHRYLHVISNQTLAK